MDTIDTQDRQNPYQLVFGAESIDDRLFPPIAEEAEARKQPLDDPDRFLFLSSVGKLIQAIAEPDGYPDRPVTEPRPDHAPPVAGLEGEGPAPRAGTEPAGGDPLQPGAGEPGAGQLGAPEFGDGEHRRAPGAIGGGPGEAAPAGPEPTASAGAGAEAPFGSAPAASSEASPEASPEAREDALKQYGRLLYHAFHYWRGQKPTRRVNEEDLRWLLDEVSSVGDWTLTPPTSSGYLQLPRNLIWAEPAPGLTPEPADGFFWHFTEPDGLAPHLHVLLVLGVRPDRAGFSVVPATGVLDDERHWAEVDGRPDGLDFETSLPGGEMDELYSIQTAAELLKLVSLCFWKLDPGAG